MKPIILEALIETVEDQLDDLRFDHSLTITDIHNTKEKIKNENARHNNEL